MDPRAIATLAWLDMHADEAVAHTGAAFAEIEILRMLVTGDGPREAGLIGEAYRRDFLRRPLSAPTRSDARALAHAAMFAGNFGRNLVVVSEAWMSCLSDIAAEHAGDTDTLGELLIAAHIFGFQSPALTVARARFDADWQAIPRQFANYHAIMVGGILYALD